MKKPSRDCRNISYDAKDVKNWQEYADLSDLEDYSVGANIDDLILFLESRHVLAVDEVPEDPQ